MFPKRGERVATSARRPEGRDPGRFDRHHEDLLAPTTELLKLSEFKEWLKKYDLKGS